MAAKRTGPAERLSLLLSIIAVLVAIILLSAVAPASGVTHPFDPYPGFGRSRDAALRDDAIALWEAYRRDVFVAECMSGAGFDFLPEVAFPAQPIIAVANYLDVSVLPMPAETDPEVWNAEYRAGLSAAELDAYYQAYVAESAVDMAYFEANHGETPLGRDPETFARGGCVGSALNAIGSIWNLWRALESEFDQMDAEILASAELAQARLDFSTCMVTNSGVPADGPAAAEELIAAIVDSGGVGDADAVMASLDSCTSIWEEGYQAADADAAGAFISRNQTALQIQQANYQDASQVMLHHAGFNEWLRIAAGAVAFDQIVSGDGSHPLDEIGA